MKRLKSIAIIALAMLLYIGSLYPAMAIDATQTSTETTSQDHMYADDKTTATTFSTEIAEETSIHDEKTDEIIDTNDETTEVDDSTDNTDGLIDDVEKDDKPIQLTEEQLVDIVMEPAQPASVEAMQYDVSNIQTVAELQEAIVNVQDGQTIKLAPTFTSAPMSAAIPDVAFTIDGNNVNWTEGKITLTGNGNKTLTLTNIHLNGSGRNGYIFEDGRRSGTLNFTNSSISNSADGTMKLNVATVLDGMYIHDSKGNNTGSAIWISSDAALTVRNSTIANNVGSASGYEAGAISTKGYTAVMTIENSVFRNNVNEGFYTGVLGGGGGAIHMNNFNGTLNIKQTVFDNNKALGSTSSSSRTADDGGAIFIKNANQNATLNISESTFSNNFASDDGGAIMVEGKGKTYISNSTFTDNLALGLNGGNLSGGAIQFFKIGFFSAMTNNVTNSTFVNNQAGNESSRQNQNGGAIGLSGQYGSSNASINGSLFAGNRVYDASGNLNVTSEYKDVSRIGDTDLGFNNVINLDADTHPLKSVFGNEDVTLEANRTRFVAGYNQEPIPTLIIKPDSVADNTNNAVTGTDDQRGYARHKSNGAVQIASIRYNANGGRYALEALERYQGTIYYEAATDGVIKDYYTVGVIGEEETTLTPDTSKLMRDGFRFIGWALQPDATEPVYGPDEHINYQSENQVLYALWEEIPTTFSVKYFGNTNTAGDAPIDVTEYLEGATATLLGEGTLIKDGYRFIGWNTQADGFGTVYLPLDTLTMTEDVLLYAMWDVIPVTYRITYFGNNHSSGVVPIDINNYLNGARAKILGARNLIKFGYQFTGWNTKADGTGVAYVGGQDVVIFQNLDLYAQWTKLPKKYVVMYDGNGHTSGSEPVDSNAYETQALVIVKGPETLLKAGYTFKGWNTQKDGAGTTYREGSELAITDNVTLYAIWIKDGIPETYRVIYDGNGFTDGSVPVDAKQYLDGDVAVISTPTMTRKGYTFVGWNTQSDGQGTAFTIGQEVSMHADVKVFAIWKKDKVVLPPTGITSHQTGYIILTAGVMILVLTAKRRKVKA
ncbi:InlB B-repeat-containing protein [Erysipelothrix anatis]|uniref:InlB B-repeat-containing protein n=1 Tax=Erysipelothrix anatis TaxID=2683713 RepID=UPI001359E210|nr:InlB B-repeat-containing protein [Erysipelothrix anatis]